MWWWWWWWCRCLNKILLLVNLLGILSAGMENHHGIVVMGRNTELETFNLTTIHNNTINKEDYYTIKNASQKFTIEQLLNTIFPRNVSSDVDMDPCKSDIFQGDIAIPVMDDPFYDNIKKIKDPLYQKEVEKYKQEVLEGLQIEEEGLTDYVRQKTKQPSSLAIDENNNGRFNGKTTNNVIPDELISGNHNQSTLKSISINQKINREQEQVIAQDNNDDKGMINDEQQKNSKQTSSHHVEQMTTVEVPAHEFLSDFDTVDSSSKKRTTTTNYTENQRRRVTRAATARKERVWDYGVIPYEIDANFSGLHKALFKQAMRHWENFTCVKFVERNRDEHQNYIIFTERPCGCCSFVGKRGNGGQAISIGKNCDKFGIVVHELGHVVGFWHEHTRPDRDQYVNIIRDNIMSGQEYNFNKLTEEEVNSLGLIYDYDSIMHYARNTFSKGTYLDTIRPVDVAGKKRPEIGQRVRLSEIDIAQTNLLYKCPACGRTFQTNSATFSPSSLVDPQNPDLGLKCEWRITATHGEKIVLNITELDIVKSPECKEDFVEVRDGYWHKSPLLGVFCGTGQIPTLISTGPRMLVKYVTKNPKGHRGFIANYEAVCGGNITIDSVGHLESPNFPEEYQPNKECIWRITVPQEYQVALIFQSFDVENHDGCVYDRVEVRDGNSLDSPLILVHCGHKIPNDIIASSNQILVKFVSDSSVQKAGFSAIIMKEYDECSKLDHGCEQECVNQLGTYACKCRIGYELHSDGKHCEDACGGLLEVENGTITSPSFPDLYPSNKNCVWEIRVKPNHKITLNFTHFDLEGNNDSERNYCEYDYVDVFSKLSENHILKHGTFCGTKSPGMITSDTNIMRIVFSSDTSVQKTGFAAVFFTDVDECATNRGYCEHECINTLGSYVCSCHNGYTLMDNGRNCKEGGCKFEITESYGSLGSPNYPDYYPPKKDCVWHFSTTPGHRIRIIFKNFELEPHQQCAYDHIDFYDGSSPESPSLGRFCGSKLPPFIVASGNQLYMTFRSDTSVQKNGFWAIHSTVCGGQLRAAPNKKHIYSHTKFGSVDYDQRTKCDWTITAPSGYNVYLSFLTFDLEDEKDCGYDYVEIYSGLDSSGPSYGKFCGTKKPFDIISTYDSLLIHFRTDDTISSKGFSLVYQAVETSMNKEDEEEEEVYRR